MLLIFILRAYYFLRSRSASVFLPTCIFAFTLLFLCTVLVAMFASDIISKDRDDVLEQIAVLNGVIFGILFLLLTVLGRWLYSSMSSLAMTSALRFRLKAFRKIIFMYSSLQLFRCLFSFARIFGFNAIQELADKWFQDPLLQHWYFLFYVIWYNLVEIVPCVIVIVVLENVFPSPRGRLLNKNIVNYYSLVLP
ncbi:hypothetical protein GEMRC1_004052 [Eukaryota sp. GEM-RC1]